MAISSGFTRLGEARRKSTIPKAAYEAPTWPSIDSAFETLPTAETAPEGVDTGTGQTVPGDTSLAGRSSMAMNPGTVSNFGRAMGLAGTLSGNPALGLAISLGLNAAQAHNQGILNEAFATKGPENVFAFETMPSMLQTADRTSELSIANQTAPSFSQAMQSLAGLLSGSRTSLSPDDPTGPTGPTGPFGEAPNAPEAGPEDEGESAPAAPDAGPFGDDATDGGPGGGTGVSGDTGADASAMHQGGQVPRDMQASLQGGETVIPRGPFADLTARLIAPAQQNRPNSAQAMQRLKKVIFELA